MKSSSFLWVAAVLCGAPMLMTSCTTITGERTTSADYKAGVAGGKVTETTRVRATVTAVDTAKRKVTLVTPAGEKFVVKAGEEVINFPQIRVGDQLMVTYSQEVVVRMAKPGEATRDTGDIGAQLSPVGAKPGGSVDQTVQVTATVTKIDSKRRKVTLQFSDGSWGKFAVRNDIDLAKHKVGEKVVIRVQESLAVKMEKP